jgi:hypothetical protein
MPPKAPSIFWQLSMKSLALPASILSSLFNKDKADIAQYEKRVSTSPE